jgi:hypothetical protein
MSSSYPSQNTVQTSIGDHFIGQKEMRHMLTAYNTLLTENKDCELLKQFHEAYALWNMNPNPVTVQDIRLLSMHIDRYLLTNAPAEPCLSCEFDLSAVSCVCGKQVAHKPASPSRVKKGRATTPDWKVDSSLKNPIPTDEYKVKGSVQDWKVDLRCDGCKRNSQRCLTCQLTLDAFRQ